LVIYLESLQDARSTKYEILKSNIIKTRDLNFCHVGSCAFCFTALYSARKWLNMGKTWNLLCIL